MLGLTSKASRRFFKAKPLVLLSVFLILLFFASSALAMDTESYQQGLTFGENYSAKIMQNIAEIKSKIIEKNINPEELVIKAKEAEKLYLKILPEKVEWMKGVADSTGIPYEDILIFNTFDKKIVGFEGECTTFLAHGKALASGKGTMIMKNRDLNSNTLCEVSIQEQATQPKGAIYKAAYIDIPQVETTYKFVGNRTAGRWGYGMGINEHQVIAADNDAPSRDILDFTAGLHDNDVIRLILERAKTAREGVNIVAELVEQYGQAWNGIMFEIGDPNELWIVEVTGHRWVAKKYSDTITARSNQYQIEDDYDLCSSDLIDFAVKQDWIPAGTEKINFRQVYSTVELYPEDNDLQKRKNVEKLYNTEVRYQRAMELLRANIGKVTIRTMMDMARDHFDAYTLPSGKIIEMNQVPFYSTKYSDSSKREWVAETPNDDKISVNMFIRSICSHGFNGNTSASAILVARPDVPNELGLMLHAFSPPCNSAYIPFYVGINKVHPAFETPIAGALFHEIYSLTFGHYNLYHDAIRNNFDPFEEGILKELPEIEKMYIELKETDNQKATDLLNEYILKKCNQALSLVYKAQQDMTQASYDSFKWSR